MIFNDEMIFGLWVGFLYDNFLGRIIGLALLDNIIGFQFYSIKVLLLEWPRPVAGWIFIR